MVSSAPSPGAATSSTTARVSDPSVKRARRLRTSSLGAVLCALATSLLGPGTARGDTGQVCTDAHYKTQVLRKEEKLEEAIKQAEVCARDECPDWMSETCTRWKGELEARLATIIVDVVDASGKPVTEGTASLDGVPWLDSLGGPARVVPKGSHTLVITVRGEPPQEKTIVVREGEKNRKITITLPPKASPPPPPNPWHTFGPWIVGGLGVAVLIGGAVTGGLTVEAYEVMQAQCNEEEGVCSQKGLDAQERGKVLGPVTTGLLVGGGVLVAAGVIWLVAAPTGSEPATTSFFVVPAVSGHEAGVVLGGAW